LKPGLWNNIHAAVDYGDSEGFVEGSEFMPEGYPAALKVLCEGGFVEFMFRAGGVSVEMRGADSLVVYEPGKSYALDAKPGDAYENQASYFASGMAACRLPARRRRRGSPSCAPRPRAGRSNLAQWLRFSVSFAPFDCYGPARWRP
jgi:hypothetical protein